jgi:hypothetical protein
VKAVAEAIGDVYFDPRHNKCYCPECESTRKRRKVPAAVSGATGGAALSPVLLKGLQSGECGWSGEGRLQRFVQVENCDPDRIVRSEQRVAVHSRPLGWCRMGVLAPAFASDPALQVRYMCRLVSARLIGLCFVFVLRFEGLMCLYAEVCRCFRDGLSVITAQAGAHSMLRLRGSKAF